MSIRTRFSPSPTGSLHIGSARTTLFSALYAAKHEGEFVLRIEDTDALRSLDEHVASLLEDMHWLGVEWQEGPEVDGPYGPYWQSMRQEVYAKYYEVLTLEKKIYPCFCSDQELALARKLQLSRGHAPRYAGTCLKLSHEEIAARLARGDKPAWRFAVPKNTRVEFIDAIKGLQQFQTNDIGDFIVRRGDGTAPFLFCNAIDDSLMKISHVIRGEDHLANTPRQIMILQALNLSVPHYAHLSLIVGDDGAKLSKRHGSFSVGEMRGEGYLALAIINYLARLGHHCESPTLLNFDQLAACFDLEKISHSPARFDLNQLLYWQKMAVQHLDLEALLMWLGEGVLSVVPENVREPFAKTVQANIAFPHEAGEWTKIFFENDIEMNAEALSVIQSAGEPFFTEAIEAVNRFGISLDEVIAHMKSTLKLSGKKLFMPLRVALTGREDGPELKAIAVLLGKEKMVARFQRAVGLVKGV